MFKDFTLFTDKDNGLITNFISKFSANEIVIFIFLQHTQRVEKRNLISFGSAFSNNFHFTWNFYSQRFYIQLFISLFYFTLLYAGAVCYMSVFLCSFHHHSIALLLAFIWVDFEFIGFIGWRGMRLFRGGKLASFSLTEWKRRRWRWEREKFLESRDRCRKLWKLQCSQLTDKKNIISLSSIPLLSILCYMKISIEYSIHKNKPLGNFQTMKTFPFSHSPLIWHPIIV